MGERAWHSRPCCTCSQTDAREKTCYSMVTITATTERNDPTGTSRNTTDLAVSPCILNFYTGSSLKYLQLTILFALVSVRLC